jgi:hypothetical protein
MLIYLDPFFPSSVSPPGIPIPNIINVKLQCVEGQNGKEKEVEKNKIIKVSFIMSRKIVAGCTGSEKGKRDKAT